MDTAARENGGAADGADAGDAAGVRPSEEAETGRTTEPEPRPGGVPAGRRWWHWWR